MTGREREKIYRREKRTQTGRERENIYRREKRQRQEQKERKGNKKNFKDYECKNEGRFKERRRKIGFHFFSLSLLIHRGKRYRERANRQKKGGVREKEKN